MVATQNLALLTCVTCLAIAGATHAAELALAENGQSAYQIVVADDASPSTKYAAEELQKFFEQMTGAKLPIVSDQVPLGSHELVLGNNARLKQRNVDINFSTLGHEGYVIQTAGNHLVIAGGDLRGTLYGVYGLLDDHLGCRWFTPTVSHIPKYQRLTLPQIDERQVPALEYREPYTYDCFDGDWCARNRVNSSSGRLEQKHGGKVMFGQGYFVHTFNRLVPPDKYFDEHPEYFSLIDGQRKKDRSQLCCTNPDVIRLCTEGIRQAMRAQSNAFVFSVSQNDWHNYCQCDNCQAIARREGSQMAPVLELVNQVAADIQHEFPDKAVETLAYQWTRHAPKTLTPRPNVIVRLCSIECCFTHPLATCNCDANQKFREDAEAWAKIANRLWVWDYVTDFRQYLLPFPNQRVRNDNIRFFIQNNVTGIFEQDTYNTPHSELTELGGYLTAKFLWNPNYDEDTAINEFLAGYYRQAADPIRDYIDMIHDKVADENIHVNIWAEPESPHLTDQLLVKADRLWQQAEDVTSGDPPTLRRVQLSRMSVDYAILERAGRRVIEKRPANPELHTLAVIRSKPFFETLQSCPLSRIQEWTVLDKDEYIARLTQALASPSSR